LATPQYSNYYDILANFARFIKRFCSHFRKNFDIFRNPLAIPPPPCYNKPKPTGANA